MNKKRTYKKTISFILAMIFTLTLLMPQNISASSGHTPLLEIELNSSTKIYGVTAQHHLGKKTGTLEELAKAVITDDTVSYMAFPANFFHSYSDLEIVGAVYSQGRRIYDSWLDWGTGFDANNKLHLFKFYSARPAQTLNVQTEQGDSVEIVTAFNCYPWHIRNGTKQTIEPIPGADANYLNMRALRAYMGQKANGNFVYGIVQNATVREVQDICVNLGLVNAVNTDGGASAGLYRDGKYIATPGRQLASAVVIVVGTAPPPSYSDTPSDWAAQQVNSAIRAGLVPSSLRNKYNAPITRAEFAALAVALHETVNGRTITGRTRFNDTTDINAQKAAAIGVMSPQNRELNLFGPNVILTRQDSAGTFVRLANLIGKPLPSGRANFADNRRIASWAIEPVGRVAAARIMSAGSGNNFNPTDSLTREECIAAMWRIYNR